MFADAEVRLGRATQARLVNCTAVFNGGDPVPAMFSNPASLAGIGTAGMYARSPRITVASEYACLVEDGISVVVDHPAALDSFYLVGQRLPDELHTGLVTFMLESGA